MSGVLDRMVQRSHGQLPAIEPLVRAQQTAAAALPLVVEDNAATVSRVRNVAVAGQQRARREESARLVRDDVRRDVGQASEPIRKDSRSSGALEVAGVRGAAESDGKPVANDADRDGLNGTRLERNVAQEGEEPRASSIEMRAEKVPAKSKEAAGENIRTKASVERRPTSLDTPAVRNEAGDGASAAEAAEQTEIHITIGSVELRAPRVVPVPSKAPPFRPRVTLDDFLKRGPGSGWGAKS
jgi:hypothetical protein